MTRILIVDEDVAQRASWSCLLSDEGVHVQQTTFDQAHQIVQAERFDLVITDRGMPKKLGTALADELHDARPDLPIILTSGSHLSDPDDSISYFLSKPFTMSDLARAVNQAFIDARND